MDVRAWGVYPDAREPDSQGKAEKFSLQVAMSGVMSTRGGGSRVASSSSGMEAPSSQVSQTMRPILVLSVTMHCMSGDGRPSNWPLTNKCNLRAGTGGRRDQCDQGAGGAAHGE